METKRSPSSGNNLYLEIEAIARKVDAASHKLNVPAIVIIEMAFDIFDKIRAGEFYEH